MISLVTGQMATDIGRRKFVATIGGAAAAWPLAARAVQPERMRRIGVLTGGAANDPVAKGFIAAFLEALQQLGWTDGRNVRIDTRWAAGNATDARKYSEELVALAPEVILSIGVTVEPLLQVTHTIPIVFAIVVDPVGSGFVDSLSQPAGNATGFMQFEYSLCGKWLELLKEIAPSTTRAAVLRDSADTSGIGQFAIIQSVATSVAVDVRPLNMGEATEIERAVAAVAHSANGGLIVLASALWRLRHRDLIVTLAAQHKLPMVYFENAALSTPAD